MSLGDRRIITPAGDLPEVDPDVRQFLAVLVEEGGHMGEEELYSALAWPEDRFYHVLGFLKESDTVRTISLDDERMVYLKGIFPSSMGSEEIKI